MVTKFDKRLDRLEAVMVPPVVPTVRIVYEAFDGQPERVVVSDATGRHEVTAGIEVIDLPTQGAPVPPGGVA